MLSPHSLLNGGWRWTTDISAFVFSNRFARWLLLGWCSWLRNQVQRDEETFNLPVFFSWCPVCLAYANCGTESGMHVFFYKKSHLCYLLLYKYHMASYTLYKVSWQVCALVSQVPYLKHCPATSQLSASQALHFTGCKMRGCLLYPFINFYRLE